MVKFFAAICLWSCKTFKEQLYFISIKPGQKGKAKRWDASIDLVMQVWVHLCPWNRPNSLKKSTRLLLQNLLSCPLAMREKFLKAGFCCSGQLWSFWKLFTKIPPAGETKRQKRLQSVNWSFLVMYHMDTILFKRFTCHCLQFLVYICFDIGGRNRK